MQHSGAETVEEQRVPAGAGWRRSAADHHALIVSAEARRLVHTLGLVSPMPVKELERLSGAARWSEGSFDAAIAEGVRSGLLERLPFGFVGIGGG